jgi:hypothetical protein
MTDKKVKSPDRPFETFSPDKIRNMYSSREIEKVSVM